MGEPRRFERDERVPPHPKLAGYYAREEDRPRFVRSLFDGTARHYDRIERRMAFGSGRWYRRNALRRAGLEPGMTVLDVAIGTGLVAREAARLTGSPGTVVGLDPSAAMVSLARNNLGVSAVMGLGEQLPWREGSFDFLSLGYGLRHLSDLTVAFREFARVLKPGGTVCLLELTPPTGKFGRAFLRVYLRRVVPALARLSTRDPGAGLLMEYFWDTVESCVPPARIISALAEAGFQGVERALSIGLFSEYTAYAPGPRRAPARPRDRDNFFVRRMESLG